MLVESRNTFSVSKSVVVLTLVFGFVSLAQGQQENPQANDKTQKSTPEKVSDKAQPATSTKPTETEQTFTNAPPKKPAVDQKKLVNSIYELTKTTKSAKELTAFLKKCDAALKNELTKANSEYVISLSGWALNLRGKKRLEMAEQFKSMGSSQFKKALAQAMEDFDAAVIRDPKRHRSWMSRGNAFMTSEDYRKAALDFTTVIKLKTDLVNGWFNRAEALYHLGQFQQAANDYGVALSMESDDAQALTGRGHSYFALGKVEDALADYQRVAELLPNNEMAIINIGDAYHRLGRFDEAEEQFKKSLALKETSVGAQRIAWLKATCPEQEYRNADEAIKFAKRAIELEENSTFNSVANLETLAAAEASKGNFEVAKSTQQKVIQLASAEEDVLSESEQEANQARLALYEKGLPFTEQADSASENQVEIPAIK